MSDSRRSVDKSDNNKAQNLSPLETKRFGVIEFSLMVAILASAVSLTVFPGISRFQWTTKRLPNVKLGGF